MELKERAAAARAINVEIRRALKHNLERSTTLVAKCRETLREFVKLRAQPVRASASVARKKKHKVRLRLVVSNDSSESCGSASSPTTARPLEVRRKLLDMTNPRIFDLSTSNLLDRSLRDPASGGHLTPAPLRGLEMRQNGLVHGTHGGDSNPVSGFTQPSNGGALSLRCVRMGRPRIPAAKTTPVVSTFIENVEALLPVCFPTAETETDQIEALAIRAGVGRETIRRAMRGGAACRLDIVAKVATALGLTTPQLLTQGFGALRAAEQRASARQEPIPTRRSSSSL